MLLHPRVLALVVGLASVAIAQKPAPRVIVPSGAIVDGRGLARFNAPQSTGGSHMLFRAISEGITLPEGDATREVIGSGATLPSPLRGTINTFVQVNSTDDGFIVFDAELNGPDADRGIFALDGRVLTTIVTLRIADGQSLTPFELDPPGMVVFATHDGVYRWTRATASRERLVELSAPLVDGPQIARDGSVVWIANDAVVYWAPGSGVRDVARLGQPSALGGTAFTSFARSNVDVASGAGVAFLATTSSVDAAFLWSPLTGETQVVAKVGDLVEGDPIMRLDTIRMDSDDSIYFRARVDRRNR